MAVFIVRYIVLNYQGLEEHMNIFTVGYEGTNIDEVLDVLKGHNIDTLLDVRLTPLSRKSGFSKTALSSYLFGNGIAYIHVKSLGCPNSIRNPYKEDGNWDLYTNRYKKFLETRIEDVMDITSIALTTNCCLLCFERNANFCHRSFIADRMVEVSNGLLERIDLLPQLTSSTQKFVKTTPLFPGLVCP